MTKVATVNVPQVVVETTPSDVFFAWQALDALTRAQAFAEVLKVHALNSTIRIPCEDEGEAKKLVELLRDNGPTWQVPVLSDTYYANGIEYIVHGRGIKATSCTCADFSYRGGPCKHMMRVNSRPREYGVPE